MKIFKRLSVNKFADDHLFILPFISVIFHAQITFFFKFLEKSQVQNAIWVKRLKIYIFVEND